MHLVKDRFAEMDFSHPCLIAALRYVVEGPVETVAGLPAPQELTFGEDDDQATICTMVALRARRIQSRSTHKMAA